MSYILDALKKSEQERGHGNIPGVQTVHSSSLNYNSNKTYWPYILIAAVVLNLAAILYFVIDNEKPSENHVVTKTPAVENNIAPLTAAKNTQTTETAAEQQQPADTESITDNSPADEVNINPAPQSSTASKASTMPAPETPRKNPTQNTATADRDIAKNTKVIEFHELPESIKQRLPAIIISGHVYSSNPLQRSIVINNNFMEEGEYFLDDLVLHEITADGAIFYYNDIKFHLGVVSGWQ